MSEAGKPYSGSPARLSHRFRTVDPVDVGDVEDKFAEISDQPVDPGDWEIVEDNPNG